MQHSRRLALRVKYQFFLCFINLYDHILFRIEAIARMVHFPYKTVAEQEMKVELKTICKKTEDLHLGVEQVQAMHEFRKSQVFTLKFSELF